MPEDLIDWPPAALSGLEPGRRAPGAGAALLAGPCRGWSGLAEQLPGVDADGASTSPGMAGPPTGMGARSCTG